MNLFSVPRYLQRGGWRESHLLAALVLPLAAGLAMFDAWLEIGRVAMFNEEHSHILLVPVVVAWLVYVRRGRFKQCRPVGRWVGPLLIAASWIVAAYGFQHGVVTFWYLGALLIVVGALIAALGVEIIPRFLPAFGALLFLIPMPARLWHPAAIHLQNITAQITAALLDMAGVAVERSGNLLQINGVDVAIAEACNGLRMVFALMLVSYAFVFGTPLRGYVRILIIALSPLCAIACNVIRLIPTLWLYGYTPIDFADLFHQVSGWFMVAVAYLILLGLVRLLAWAMLPVKSYKLAAD